MNYSLQWLSKITAEVKEASYFTIIADETKDVSKREQLSICLRYVYDDIIHERDLYMWKSLMHQHLLNTFSKCLVSFTGASMTVSVSAMRGHLS